MFGSLDISTSALVAQRQRMTAVAQNMALSTAAVDPNADPDAFRRRMPIFAPGDPATGRPEGVHVNEILYDQAPFRKALEPGHKFADRDGYVQYTNIDPAMEMINAMEATRAYEANITAAEASKSMMQTSLRLLG